MDKKDYINRVMREAFYDWDACPSIILSSIEFHLGETWDEAQRSLLEQQIQEREAANLEK